MRTIQTNRLAMYKEVDSYMARHNDVWSEMSPLTVALQTFKGKILDADNAVQLQETPTGATDTKAAARDELEEVVFLTGEALSVLGHADGDGELLSVTDLTRASLDRLPDDELITRGNAVLDRANARKTDLATLQVTQGNLQEFTQKLQQFSTLKLQPRSDAVEHAAKTQSLASIMREANAILRNQIDRMVNLFSRTNPEFVSGYRAARVVVDRAATHKTKTAGQAPPNPKP